jgi:L-2-hydroxyglutarate oxidase
MKNTKYFIPKIIESIKAPGTLRILFDRQFLSLLGHEVQSSLSKTIMINRVKKFIPKLKPSAFMQRGTAGIRSQLIDAEGKFVPDTMLVKEDYSLHLLNYNSPGATGALPIGAAIADYLLRSGIIDRKKKEKKNPFGIFRKYLVR